MATKYMSTRFVLVGLCAEVVDGDLLFSVTKDRCEAVQLTWATWSEVCEFAGVGRFVDGRPEGVYINDKGDPIREIDARRDQTVNRIGLMIPQYSSALDTVIGRLAKHGDWLVRFPALCPPPPQLQIYSDDVFRREFAVDTDDALRDAAVALVYAIPAMSKPPRGRRSSTRLSKP